MLNNPGFNSLEFEGIRNEAVLIHQGLAAPDRLAQLNVIAITQMRSLVGMGAVKRLGGQNTPKAIDS